jgi:pimeloyl-ACP methyl ester carboxylesterase
VLVHGAWADGRHWTRLANELEGFRVVTYDRRGHGRSGGHHSSINDDVDDLAGLIESLGAPAHVVGGSFGGSVALRLAIICPRLLQSLSLHEPALGGLLGGSPQSPERIPSPEEFAEQSLGEGAWDWLSEDERDGFRDNGEVWRDELADAEALSIDTASLEHVELPVMITLGSEGAPFFQAIAEALAAKLPSAEVRTIEGAGHLPHLTHAREYAEVLGSVATAAAARR